MELGPEIKQPFGRGGSEGLLSLFLPQRGFDDFEFGSGLDQHLEPLSVTRNGYRIEAVGVSLRLALGVPTKVLEVVRG